jgi:hypothetical protein
MADCNRYIVSSLMNYRLVAAGYRIGAIIDFVPGEAVLYSSVDMSKGKTFLILNKDDNFSFLKEKILVSLQKDSYLWPLVEKKSKNISF